MLSGFKIGAMALRKNSVSKLYFNLIYANTYKLGSRHSVSIIVKRERRILKFRSENKYFLLEYK